MSQRVENFKDCIGTQLAVVPQPELQEWNRQQVDNYFKWAYSQLVRTASQDEANELAMWWFSHPANTPVA